MLQQQVSTGRMGTSKKAGNSFCLGSGDQGELPRGSDVSTGSRGAKQILDPSSLREPGAPGLRPGSASFHGVTAAQWLLTPIPSSPGCGVWLFQLRCPWVPGTELTKRLHPHRSPRLVTFQPALKFAHTFTADSFHFYRLTNLLTPMNIRDGTPTFL